jgi:hypothetical protein
MGRLHQQRGTVSENQQWQKEECIEKSHNYCSTCGSRTEYSPVSTKTARCELHKSNIHSRVATAKPLFTKIMLRCIKDGVTTIKLGHQTTGYASYGQMRRVILHAVLYIGRSLRLEIIQGTLQSWMPSSNNETRERFCDGWAAISWYFVGPITTLYGRITAGSTWTGWVIMCLPWSRHYFWTTIQFSNMIMPPFT